MKTRFTHSGPRYRLRLGAGYNWFDYLGMGGHFAESPAYPLNDRVYPDDSDEVSWGAILAELDYLRPGIIRFGFPPDPHLSPTGGLVTATPHFARLRRVARWAAKHNCTILLDTFSLPRRHAGPRPAGAAPSAMVQMAARDNRSYAREFVAPLLRFITADADFDAVKFFNPVNEPMCYGIYQTPAGGPDVWDHYVEMYREMRAALDAAGVSRGRIGLAGVDHTSPSPMTMLELLERAPSIDPYVDAYTIHYYYLRFDHCAPRPRIAPTATIEDAMDRQTAALVRVCQRRGKPLWAVEIGTFYNGWRFGNPAGPAAFDTTLIVAEAVIRGLNIGLDGFAFWSLFNPNTIDGHWAILRLDRGRVARQGWPGTVYSSITRSVRPGCEVIPLQPTEFDTDLPGLHATALRGADGDRVVLVVNDHPSEPGLAEFDLPADFGILPACRRMIQGGTSSPAARPTGTDLEIAPMSLCLYSDATPEELMPD